MELQKNRVGLYLKLRGMGEQRPQYHMAVAEELNDHWVNFI